MASTPQPVSTTSTPATSPDSEELPVGAAPHRRSAGRHQIARDTVTLVFGQGSAALANTLELEQAGVGWISALPWNQAPAEFRERDTGEAVGL